VDNNKKVYTTLCVN